MISQCGNEINDLLVECKKCGQLLAFEVKCHCEESAISKWMRFVNVYAAVEDNTIINFSVNIPDVPKFCGNTIMMQPVYLFAEHEFIPYNLKKYTDD